MNTHICTWIYFSTYIHTHTHSILNVYVCILYKRTFMWLKVIRWITYISSRFCSVDILKWLKRIWKTLLNFALISSHLVLMETNVWFKFEFSFKVWKIRNLRVVWVIFFYAFRTNITHTPRWCLFFWRNIRTSMGIYD